MKNYRTLGWKIQEHEEIGFYFETRWGGRISLILSHNLTKILVEFWKEDLELETFHLALIENSERRNLFGRTYEGMRS